MQLVPSETQLTPGRATEHSALAAALKSPQAFTLQASIPSVYPSGKAKVHIPSVPSAHPSLFVYVAQACKAMHLVPSVVHFVLAVNAEHPA